MRVLITSLASSQRLCEALLRHAGLEVATVQPAFADLGDFGVTRTEARSDLPYLLRPARVFPVRPYPYSLYLNGVAPVLRSFRPQVLYHVGEPSELGTAQIVRLARKLRPGIRIVLFALENVERQWRGFPRCLRGWAQRRTLPRVDLIAACTHTVEALLVRQGFDPQRIRVVYAGVDAQHFRRRDPTELRAKLDVRDAFLVGYVGRLVHEKGVDVLLKALAKLPQQFLPAIAGTGCSEPELRAVAADLNLEGRVRWLGGVSPDRMPEYLSAFDVLVLPSRGIPVWQEQFGRVLAEAMLCQTPVVGSSSGAIPEVIGQAGLVFPEGDAQALAECLLRLEQNPSLREELARCGLQRARQEFTLDVFTERLVSIFHEALDLPAARS